MKKVRYAVPLSVFLFLGSVLYPHSVNRLGAFYNYRFGFPEFLEIRRADEIRTNRNLFRMVYGCDNFYLNLLGMAGCYLIALACAWILLRLTDYRMNRPKKDRQNR